MVFIESLNGSAKDLYVTLKNSAGTTAHVGISLHGLNKSGSRHLQRDGAFQRNGLDDFQVETDVSLGEIWKICIWHDNTGTDKSWEVGKIRFNV
ncbi:hypothetical protein QTP70_006347 [Hemibagrus guttatus]|uniref:PLAT domain-containing protein n=1 Tax=Hemibagrus guttatus TaxID=175788 RepID=A0AAE0UYN0_9TELE|nr:hypothetical protein QTP70_006347 [Hemibagrus guttatus]